MCFLHELLDYGEYPFTEHKTDELTCATNSSTGDATTPYRAYTPGTHRERQRSVKVMLQCIHKVAKEVVDDGRPELRDGRYENRPSWSHSRPESQPSGT